jgi:GWxTD domain-containing protein
MKKLLLFLVFLPIAAFPQMRMQGNGPFNGPIERLIYDVSSLPANDLNKSRISVSIKAPYEFLVFTKSPERTSKDFIGSFDLSIEIFDKNKNSVDRKIKQEVLELSKLEKSNLRDKFYEASFDFDVDPGEYNIILEFNDRESDNSIRREIKIFKAKEYKQKNISDILFFPPLVVDSIKPINYSGNIPFGESCSLYAELSGYQPEKDQLILRLFKMNDKKRDSVYSLSIPREYIHKKTAENKIDTISGLSVIEMPFKTDTFAISKYEIQIENASNSQISTKKMFDIQWYKMPFSLRDFDIAQKYLKLITSENEFDNLKSGSKNVQREKFIEFWKKHDPTPSTAYNELMTEFYKRVDYSIINFSTVSTPDGSETDRGKTYILNGKPDETERTLNPNEAPFEIWTYKKINKKYIFIDESRQGNYKLASIEKL